jgi:CMP/dCMP kinase
VAKIVIAIDGPAASGKGTVARSVAQALDLQYIDTGAMFRTVALRCLERGILPHQAMDAERVARTLDFSFRWEGDSLLILEQGEDVTKRIRTEEMGMAASRISVLPGVRMALLEKQRDIAAQGGVIMDGRDIGTVVLPEADLKIYLDATLAVRAHRRWLELRASGTQIAENEVSTQILARDIQDQRRKHAPLRQAEDAHIVDTSNLSQEDVLEAIVTLAKGVESVDKAPTMY